PPLFATLATEIRMRYDLPCYKMSVYPGINSTSQSELSQFLKSRRARISPTALGLAKRRRRRAPGLRREEVAELACVGLTWYTWLEQGRDIRVSRQVLTAIGRVLQLEPAERAHLFRLAGHAPPAVEAVGASLSPRLRRVLESWDPYPAHLTGRRRDLVAWNRTSDLINGWSELPEGKRNLVWNMFMGPTIRRLLVDWEEEAPMTVAALRADTSLHVAAQPSLRLYLYTPADKRTAMKVREAAQRLNRPS